MGNDHPKDYQKSGLKSPRSETRNESRENLNSRVGKKASFDDADEAFTLNDEEGLPADIYKTQLPTLLGIIGSPLLLFRLDQGAVNTNSWQAIMDHIRHAQKTVKAHQMLNQDFKQDAKVWRCVIRSTASTQYDLSRGAETPAFTGQDESHKHDAEETFNEDSDPDKLRACYAAKSELFAKLSTKTLKKLKKTERQLRIEASMFFLKLVENEQGRQLFTNWIVDHAKIQDKNHVTAQEIENILVLVSHDDILPHKLSFSPESSHTVATFVNGLRVEQRKSHQEVAAELLNEYSVYKLDYIKRNELEILLQLILAVYQTVSKEEERIYFSHYIVKRTLGEGSVAKVRLAQDALTLKEYAIKIIHKGDSSTLSRIDTEIKIMMMLQHPNIAKLEEVRESADEVFLILELCSGGNLYQFMNHQPLSERVSRYFFVQIVAATSYCHEQGVAHRDLKLDNILLDNNGVVKLADFGHAGIFNEGWDMFGTALVGGLLHVSPEKIRGQSYSGQKNDIWSLGIVLFQTLFNKSPFNPGPGGDTKQMFKGICSGHFEYPAEPAISADAKNLICNMLQVEAEARYDITQVAKHAWTTNADVETVSLSRFCIAFPRRAVITRLSVLNGVCYILKNLKINCLCTDENVKKVVEEHRSKIKCQSPIRHIKFSFKIHMHHSYVEFILDDGHSNIFLELKPIFTDSFRDCFDNLAYIGINPFALNSGSGDHEYVPTSPHTTPETPQRDKKKSSALHHSENPTDSHMQPSSSHVSSRREHSSGFLALGGSSHHIKKNKSEKLEIAHGHVHTHGLSEPRERRTEKSRSENSFSHSLSKSLRKSAEVKSESEVHSSSHSHSHHSHINHHRRSEREESDWDSTSPTSLRSSTSVRKKDVDHDDHDEEKERKREEKERRREEREREKEREREHEREKERQEKEEKERKKEEREREKEREREREEREEKERKEKKRKEKEEKEKEEREEKEERDREAQHADHKDHKEHKDHKDHKDGHHDKHHKDKDEKHHKDKEHPTSDQSRTDATSSDDDDDETLHEFVELNSNSMKDEVSDVVQQFATINSRVNTLQKPNVLVAGLQGSGKSSIINLVFNNNSAGGTKGPRPVHSNTQTKFSKYDSEDLKVVIYDSEGLEKEDPNLFISSIKDFFAEKQNDTLSAIHIIWYLIDSTRGAIELEEQALFSGVFADIPILFLLNKADESTAADRQQIRDTLTALNLKNCNGIFNVISVKSKPKTDFEVCPKCQCDDIVIYKKTSVMNCMGCGYTVNFAAMDNPLNELSKVVEATHDILPVGIRQAFVYSQNISFHLKSESAKQAIVEFWDNFSSTKTRAKLLKGVTQMLADLCFLWDFKTYGQAYAEAMANRALASFSWQDTVNLWLSRKFHAQRLKATALGILWHHCLEALIEALFEEWMYKSKCKSSEKDIAQSSNSLFDSIFLSFNDENLHIIEEEILNSDLQTVLAKKNFFFSKDKKAAMEANLKKQQEELARIPTHNNGTNK